jgi:hypothetical protein
MRSNRPQIMIADDHAFVADACKKLLEPEYEVVAMFGRCSQCGRPFSISEEALTNTEQATRAFYLEFEGHKCEEDAGFRPAEPS